MVPGEVLVGVTCALDQLLSHSGKFHEAEKVLTKALTKTRSFWFVMLTWKNIQIIHTKAISSKFKSWCYTDLHSSLMFKKKVKMEASSSIILQEGLYRRALDLLKAPALDSEGGYADLLCIQQNRKEVG